MTDNNKARQITFPDEELLEWVDKVAAEEDRTRPRQIVALIKEAKEARENTSNQQ